MDSYGECSIFAHALLSLRMGNDFGRETRDSQHEENYPNLVFAPVLNNSVHRHPLMNPTWDYRRGIDECCFADVHMDEGPRKRANTAMIATSLESDTKSPAKPFKATRGRYKCSLCGALKTNHTCALVPDKLMCSVGTQSAPGGRVSLSPRVRQALSRTASTGKSCGTTIHSFKSSSLSSSSAAEAGTGARGVYKSITPGAYIGYSSSLSDSLDLLGLPCHKSGAGPPAHTANLCNLSMSSNNNWTFVAMPALQTKGPGVPAAATATAAATGGKPAVASLAAAGVVPFPCQGPSASVTVSRSASSSDPTAEGLPTFRFQERVITVTRNRGSINAPPAAATCMSTTTTADAPAAAASAADTAMDTDSPAAGYGGGGGSSVVTNSSAASAVVCQSPSLDAAAPAPALALALAQVDLISRQQYTLVSEASSCGSSISDMVEE